MALKSEEQKEREHRMVLEDYEIGVYRTMREQVKSLQQLDRITDFHVPRIIRAATTPKLAKALREAGADLDVEKRTHDVRDAWISLHNAANGGARLDCIPHEHAEKLHDLADAVDARLAELVEENGGSFSDDPMTAFPHLVAASELLRAKAERLEATVGKTRRTYVSGPSGAAEIDVTTRTIEEQRKVAEAAEAARAERTRLLEEHNQRIAAQAGRHHASQLAQQKDLDEEVRERTAARIAEIAG